MGATSIVKCRRKESSLGTCCCRGWAAAGFPGCPPGLGSCRVPRPPAVAGQRQGPPASFWQILQLLSRGGQQELLAVAQQQHLGNCSIRQPPGAAGQLWGPSDNAGAGSCGGRDGLELQPWGRKCHGGQWKSWIP